MARNEKQNEKKKKRKKPREVWVEFILQPETSLSRFFNPLLLSRRYSRLLIRYVLLTERLEFETVK